MNLHEFQAKDILARYGLMSPGGAVAITPEEAEAVARRLGSPMIAVKAQVHAGGRGKAGGVRLVTSPHAAREAAAEMLGRKLVTAQTGPEGRIVRRVFVETGLASARDLNLAVLVDRTLGELVVLGSPEGGEDLEERALKGELKLERLPLGTGATPRHDEALAFAARLGLTGAEGAALAGIVDGLRRAFVELDASLIEINPLALTEDGRLVAFDAKMVIDDNALFRQPELAALRDDEEADPIEVQAQHHQLNYVRLDGDIGLVVNGAGLGLATLDLLREAQGRPANFMDIRTTAKSQHIAYGFGLLFDNPAVKAILVNIHGGGMQPCDTVVEGLGMAARRSGRTIPIVARLAGNNADFARSRFVNFGLPIVECPDMWTAATRAVAIARHGR
ncbi:succinyl-CoA synthetase subunit beta [Prosthecomicrobium hirschii]|uniref:Succinyl-CoA synthetase subunit beta n=1 Tax=Prosthecodimorpha hirschii TaxID=665126 RepID=A0A0P6W0J5_9HYPH|nr:ADP-forming succinate--CoA ligase subunit beta [Prosthecomicrobium hirschii]KPL52572.1 succinyl-CoA synthetase subunit beta [Prosthecomicrobium hirschii]